jgi:hypothetical protein
VCQVLPEVRSQTLVVGSTAKIDNNAKNATKPLGCECSTWQSKGPDSHESQDCSDFDDGEHKFCLPITSNTEKVDADNDGEKDGDPSGAID